MPYNKSHVVVKVPKRSGFNKSHRNSGTGMCGELIPLLCDEVIPNSRVSLKLNLATQMPPLASDTYMNVKIKAEAFFVPMRLLCKSFEAFFCDVPLETADVLANPIFIQSSKAALPVFRLFSGIDPKYFGAGSLLDYLGCKVDSIGGSLNVNPLPLLAYHLVHQEFYRNPRVTKPSFMRLNTEDSSDTIRAYQVTGILDREFHSSGDLGDNRFVDFYPDTPDYADFYRASRAVLGDGHNIFLTRQRNFGLDYFTGARVSAQQGDVAKVTIAVNEGSGDMTIAALRAANSLQQFRERNNIPSPRLVDQVKARYNANLSDGVAQRPICLGSATYDMNTRGVSQTAPGSNPDAGNIFDSVANQFGRAYGMGSDFIISDFTANEPGYIMVLISQVPEVSYTYGISPMFRRYQVEGSVVEMANPLLQNVGDQPIYADEFAPVQYDGEIFGYTDRFADFMFIPNQIHGNFRHGENLASYVAQRYDLSNEEISTAFLEIPQNYLNPVLAVDAATAECTYWYDAMLEYKVSMPLAEYSIPSLQDPAYEHGESVSLRRNGQIF